MIKTLKGIELVSTSTTGLEKPIGTVKEGTVVTIEFFQKNRLSSGEYLLSVGVSEKTENGIKPLDRVIDTKIFKVVGINKSYGLIDFDTEAKINKEITSIDVRRYTS